jgi:hypothetical protein
VSLPLRNSLAARRSSVWRVHADLYGTVIKLSKQLEERPE